MNDKINVLLIITVISLFISLLFAFFLVTVKTKYKISNYLFAAFLCITAIDVSGPLFEIISDGPSNFGMLRNTLSFLQIPVFYLYVLSVCYSDFKFKVKYILHLLPYIIVNIILLPRFYTVDLASKIKFILNRQNMIELQFTHILFHLQTIVYLVAVFMLLRKAKKLYLENNAGTSINSYNWLFQFTSVLSVLYLIVMFKNIFKFSDYPYISEWIKIVILVLELFIICWYLYKALNHPDLFRNIDSKLKLVSDMVLEEKNNEPAVANEKEYNASLSKLKQYMVQEKPFLNPSLTIQDVAVAIEIPVRDLSLLINHKLEQHFYDFVNTYRIEYAMDILKDGTKNQVTVLEILYEVGFNSKSSFNTAFKKYTGDTPTSYRKQL
ncbi:AraC-type DNA-binding protein [Flavobacterium aquidurense]|uniref:DNA-binding protein n=1 Tax=Flavobacterium frigidimaris TaxID=262320 RepID=A0ABX4BU19_FLAFR|nr:helix-turn-helix domain-containing protein [Flavobacterium frigidimaris]OXA81310.1 DNA-binding protein [Flavobacterium frigidimaris]SDZ00964.1 AraC-type DNA-binding protein [Flavobacterium aquidurense]